MEKAQYNFWKTELMSISLQIKRRDRWLAVQKADGCIKTLNDNEEKRTQQNFKFMVGT